MINLISNETKRNISAGRANVILRRYVIGLFVALFFAAAAFAAGYYLTLETKAQMQTQKEAADQRVAQYLGADAQAQEIAEGLTGAQAIIDKDLSFSTILLETAKALPTGTKLQSFTASSDDIGKPLTFEVRAISNEQALKLKDALEKSPVYSAVSLNEVNATPSGTPAPGDPEAAPAGNQTDSAYPVSVSVTATLTKPSSPGDTR